MGQEIGGWEPIRPKRAAVKVDFYLVGTEEGPSDEIENALSVIEGRASVAIRAVEAGDWPISEEHKAHLAEFLSLQRVRSTGFRESVNRSTNEIADRAYYLQEMARFGRAFATSHKRPASIVDNVPLKDNWGRS